ncbi:MULTISPECIES: pitrilysin family protein [unclassified Psychrobacter]|uniref:M16 family metallopeptidase n=1 Tax=unclassified Psychrobacter TaxID=196806 RepID=UPI0025B35589|nr:MULTISPECIES: pitrilysin family protein [unclassified Psychrobacter]MDN3454163.1 pitrilysin family protein [Psychrobacter sp. APC 3350]MDN3503074.1 pitrilysin family protein [Psychrobacter sp. 5A.1]
MPLPLSLSLSLPTISLRAACALAMATTLAACQTHTINTNPVSATQNPAAQDTLNQNTAGQDIQQSSALTMDLSGRHEYQLENGLKIVVKEDHRAPVVMTQIWYRVGSVDEPLDKGGISHLLEHMMFKGTADVSSDDYERLITKFGGVNNAFTSYDYTGYYELFPANRFPLALELEADRMKHLIFNDKEFAKEHQVVMEERRQRTDDNPLAKAYESFRLLALPDSPKGESVIGPMDELASISLADLIEWYKTWYAPNNATLVIVGDVEPKEVLAQVKRYFGDLKPSDLPTRPTVSQKGFRGYQQVDSEQAVQVPVLLMGYNVPSLVTAGTSNEKQAYALSLAQDVLDGGLSARLESRLIREQGLLTTVGTSYDLLDRGDGLFLIQATPREGVSLAQAQQAITLEIENLKTDPIATDEISRAKTNTVTGLVYAQDSMEGQARMIGSLQSIGLDDQLLAELPTKLDSVTIADIQAASKKYLVKDNLTVMHVVPPKDSAKTEK